MAKDIEHRQITSTIELTECRDGFWLYDATRRMSLATGVETPEAAFVEALEYYQKRLAAAEAKNTELEKELFVLSSDVIYFENQTLPYEIVRKAKRVYDELRRSEGEL